MREFRNELLEYLMSQSGFVSLTDLKNKYCNNPPVFKLEDQESYCKLRLGMNHILRELKKMDWIETTGEFSTGTGYPHIEGMRHFILDYEVKARITTKGEIEYNRIKKETTKEKPSVHIGEGFSGVFIQDSELRESPIISSINKPPSNTPNTNAKPGLSELITKHIGKFIIAVFTALVIAYIIFKLKWN